MTRLAYNSQTIQAIGSSSYQMGWFCSPCIQVCKYTSIQYKIYDAPLFSKAQARQFLNLSSEANVEQRPRPKFCLGKTTISGLKMRHIKTRSFNRKVPCR